jgi:Zn-dependent peptidase ImmA (M78 family)
MQRAKKIPNKPNFKHAVLRAYQLLLQLDIKTLPVDPFAIVKNIKHLYLCSWSELKKATGVEDPYHLKRDHADAKVKIIRGTPDYMIVFDDTVKSRERIRWTIAHEIGHIVLGHLVYYEGTALHRGGLTEDQYDTLEVEANFFAEALLAPSTILRHFNIQAMKEIALLCDISFDAAQKSVDHVKNYQINFQHLEMNLVKNFFQFFNNEKHHQSMVESIKKYCGRPQHKEVYNIRRICKHCRAYILDPEQKYCHICEEEIREPLSIYTRLPKIGKHYRPIATVDHMFLYCPVCKNHDFSKNNYECKECGTSSVNICLYDVTALPGSHRYCPKCGHVTTFKDWGYYDLLEEIELPDMLTFKNGLYEDYIRI